MSEHNFVRIGRTLYAFDSLDEENRIFVGYKLTKEIITDFLDDKIEYLEGPKTTILFREQGEQDVYIREATLDDFERLYSIRGPSETIYYTTKRYNNAIQDIADYEDRKDNSWLRRRLNRIIDIVEARDIVKQYNLHQEYNAKYEVAKALKEEWVLRVKEQWFS